MPRLDGGLYETCKRTAKCRIVVKRDNFVKVGVENEKKIHI